MLTSDLLFTKKRGPYLELRYVDMSNPDIIALSRENHPVVREPDLIYPAIFKF